ncbi:hypothetical protein POVCU2_0020770 [Plasmodium ovale curtisi]|uniref:Uncharacterized protein n=1 Tax=Plasmodium ovale curtisi TaxID=864141 RepID=A0A1A8WHA0_PLAOA|nr:hypothetical protein POVCU2_0020770 [Plasmodium ovale curtisi]SBS90588.1 hypothetical protein POVCU1_018670 [Plasmodium ovale curtisi]
MKKLCTAKKKGEYVDWLNRVDQMDHVKQDESSGTKDTRETNLKKDATAIENRTRMEQYIKGTFNFKILQNWIW